MIKAQYINLNMIPSGVMPVLYCSQYDVGRPLGMVVYNGSEAVDLSTYAVTIEGTRTDGTPITAAVTTDGNIGAFETTATMTNVPDFYKSQIVLTDGSGKRVASIRFMMKVNEAAMNENSEGIQENASLYQQYTGTVQTLISAVRADLIAEANRATAAEAAEASARASADASLQSDIASEASTRAAADQNLQAQVNQIIAPSGEAPSAAEIENARIGADNVTYPTLGDAIRGQVTDLKNALQAIAPFSQLLNQYLYKTNTYINAQLAEATLANYDLFKVPVSYGDVVFIKQTGGNEVFFKTLSQTYVFHLGYSDGTYATVPINSAYGTYVNTERYAMFQIPDGVVSLMVSSYNEYAQYVGIHINTPKTDITADCVSEYRTVIDITDDTAFVSKIYKQNANPPRFFILSGDYYAKTIKVHAGDVIKCSGLVGTLTIYLAFATPDNVVTNITTPTFTAPSDGMVNIMAHPNYPQTQTLFPADSIKLEYKNIVNIPEVVRDNPYDGLTGVAFGTSLTYRAQTTGGYLQFLPDLSGITFDNQGVGSSTILPHSGNPQMMPTITGYTGYSGKRVCILEGFVNDWYYNGASLGTWKDATQDTVCGCVRYAINYILTQNPNLTIFLVMDHFGKGITAADALNDAGQTQLEFYQEIEKVGLSMGVRIIREYELSEISQLTPQYLLDNIHLNALGAEQSARAIWSGMKATYPNILQNS